jgi:hypothetical protein
MTKNATPTKGRRPTKNNNFKSVTINPDSTASKATVPLDQSTLGTLEHLDDLMSKWYELNFSRASVIRRACQFYARYMKQTLKAGAKAAKEDNFKAMQKAADKLANERYQLIKVSGREGEVN